ncbi:MAG TPA: hypothetical protein VNO32_53770 [Candidatus Acidoferrum sp.]|nr:hypothetical protein [Candidatus Acidoferrum sp.]
MGSMRRPDVFRLLNWDEMFLLQQVFGLMVLPPREQIAVSNGLGLGGAPYTTTGPFGGELTPDARYAIHLGDIVSRNLTSDASTTPILGDDYSNISELFIHVMTHVWQLFNGCLPEISLWAPSTPTPSAVMRSRPVTLGMIITPSSRQQLSKNGTVEVDGPPASYSRIFN